jgi:hypothetical protein
MRLEVVVVPVADVDRAKRLITAWGGGSTATVPPAMTIASCK